MRFGIDPSNTTEFIIDNILYTEIENDNIYFRCFAVKHLTNSLNNEQIGTYFSTNDAVYTVLELLLGEIIVSNYIEIHQDSDDIKLYLETMSKTEYLYNINLFYDDISSSYMIHENKMDIRLNHKKHNVKYSINKLPSLVGRYYNIYISDFEIDISEKESQKVNGYDFYNMINLCIEPKIRLDIISESPTDTNLIGFIHHTVPIENDTKLKLQAISVINSFNDIQLLEVTPNQIFGAMKDDGLKRHDFDEYIRKLIPAFYHDINNIFYIKKITKTTSVINPISYANQSMYIEFETKILNLDNDDFLLTQIDSTNVELIHYSLVQNDKLKSFTIYSSNNERRSERYCGYYSRFITREVYNENVLLIESLYGKMEILYSSIAETYFVIN